MLEQWMIAIWWTAVGLNVVATVFVVFVGRRTFRHKSDTAAMQRAQAIMRADPQAARQFAEAVAGVDRQCARDRAAAVAARDQSLAILRDNREQIYRIARGELHVPQDAPMVCALACYAMGELVFSEAEVESAGMRESGDESPSAGEGE